jgi:hypothetical protein
MNFTLLGYIIYLPVTLYITVVVGGVLYKNGRYFLLDIFSNEEMADTYNKFLLTGYYLLNIGYASVSIGWWNTIYSSYGLIAELTWRLGFIILSLGTIHYINLYAFSRFSARFKKLYNNIHHNN